MSALPKADSDRIAARLDELAAIGASPDRAGMWRVAFSEADLTARAWFARTARQQGMDVTGDQWANQHARLPGARDEIRPFGTGSHLDTVPGGGNLDGAAGVVVALEVARLLAGGRLRHGLVVTNFTSEEVGRWGSSTIGSRGMAGRLSDAELDRTDAHGESLRAAIARTGEEASEPPRYAAFVEVHIEQGERLDVSELALAAVTGITAIRRTVLRIEGAANHAGTTIRRRRKDALLGAAAILAAVEDAWQQLDPAEEVSLTVGRFDVEPNAINVIPAAVEAVLEVRSPDAALAQTVEQQALAHAKQIGQTRGLTIGTKRLLDQSPQAFDTTLTERLHAGIRAAAGEAPALWSLAGHDAGHIGHVCPAGMVFVRTRGGISHAPGEVADPADLALAADAVAATLQALDDEHDEPV